MKQYYLHNGSENIGPFEKEELKAKNITKNTQIWSEDMLDWKKAGEIDDLKDILKPTPPPLIKSKPESTKLRKKNPLKYILISLAILAFLIIGSTLIANNTRTDESLAPLDDSQNREIRNHITDWVQVATNQYTVDTWGGITNLDIIVNNNSDFTINNGGF